MGLGGALRVTLLLRRLEGTGGAEQQLAKLAIGLQGRGFLVRVLAFYPGDSLEKDLRTAGVPVEILEKRGRWDMVGFLRRLRRAVLRERPDILQSYLGPPNVLAALIAAGSRRTRVVWGIRASELDLGRYDWTHRALEKLENLLAWRPDLIIANSHAGRNLLLRRGFPARRIEVVPNGIDVDRFQPGAADDLRAEWLAGSPGPLIGIVARLDPMKDYPTFLAAAKLLLRDMPAARFVCIGSTATPYARAILQQCEAMGLADRVRWVGSRSDIPRAMKACDVVTLSSAFGEGFPNVLGEAMACGVPVVTTDVGDAAIVVGDASRVVPVRDPSALAAAWQSVLSLPPDPAQRLRDAQRRRIVDTFSVTRMVDSTAALYRRLCEEPLSVGSPRSHRAVE